MVVDYHNDPRYAHLTPEKVRLHYEVERELAQFIMNTCPEKRPEVTAWAYEELFRRIPWHPALTERSGKWNPGLIQQRARRVVPFLTLPEGSKVLEIGCGMGELCFALADMGFRPIGVDISELRVCRNQNTRKAREWPQFLRCEASRLPFPADSFDSAVSMQLLEHLHPEDVPKHLCEVFRVLKPGGRYTFETPHVLFGPHDVSRFFSDSPEGFHLKEYSVREVSKLISTAGFSGTRIVLRYERVLQPAVAVLLETFYALWPRLFRRKHPFGLHNPFYIAVKDVAGS